MKNSNSAKWLEIRRISDLFENKDVQQGLSRIILKDPASILTLVRFIYCIKDNKYIKSLG